MRNEILVTIVGFLLLIPIGAGDTEMNTELQMENGNATLKQTSNNKTLNISVNNAERTSIETNVTEDNISYSINSSGGGQVKIESDGDNYQVNSTVDSKNDNFSGSGSFEKVFSFFNNLFISGWVNVLSI